MASHCPDGLPDSVYPHQQSSRPESERYVDGLESTIPATFYCHHLRLEQQVSGTSTIHHNPHHCPLPGQTVPAGQSHPQVAPWSPPEESGEMEHYSYQGSPRSCEELSPDYKQSPISPVSWASPRQMPFQTSNNQTQHYHLTPAMGVYTSVDHTSSTFSHPMIRDNSMTHVGYPMIRDGSTSTRGSPLEIKPPLSYPSPSTHQLDILTPFRDLDAGGTSPNMASEGIETLSSGERGKAHQSYAQLLYRALMDQPKRCMSLQDIYQWFRENTDKGKDEEKAIGNGGSKNQDGWKNSIRHNLSQNSAFETEEKRRIRLGLAPDVKSTETAESKKNSVWYLKDDAIENGVKPTSSDRNDASRKAKARRCSDRPRDEGPESSRPQQNHPRRQQQERKLSGRAMSGRKGGYASSKGHRRRRAERQKETQQHSVSSSGYIPAHPPWSEMSRTREVMRGSEPITLVDMHEPLTPETTQISYAMLPTGSSTSMMIGNAPGPGPYYTPAYDIANFSLADVSGVYNGGDIFTNIEMHAFHGSGL